MLKSFLKISLLALVLTSAFGVSANHSWGNYHWARTVNPYTLKLGDNISSTWDATLATTSTTWNLSTVLKTNIVPGLFSKNCRPTSGRVEVCNSKYGNNGWLGVAQIWVNGEHITQGIVKLNDTYFNTAKYNTPAWRNLVVCQELGHTFGLDHQDENFDNPNLGTCMDYTSNPSTNQFPNQHDYDELAFIYNHLDTFTTVKTSTVNNLNNSNSGDDWGKSIKKDKNGRDSVYEKVGKDGKKVFTFVIWAE
jgi:hypothetical protein